MTVNLIKLCVGCDSVRELEGWIKEKLKAGLLKPKLDGQLATS